MQRIVCEIHAAVRIGQRRSAAGAPAATGSRNGRICVGTEDHRGGLNRIAAVWEGALGDLDLADCTLGHGCAGVLGRREETRPHALQPTGRCQRSAESSANKR